METPSIANIRVRRAEIKESLKKVRAHDFAGAQFGSESEFTDKSVIAGIEAVLVDVDALCGAPARFIKNSTGQERKTLSALFDQLLNHCNNLDLANAANVLDQIKPIFRALGIRGSDERKVAFENHTDDLQRKSVSLAAEIEKLRATKASTEAELERMVVALTEAKEKVAHIGEISASITSELEASVNAKSQIEVIQQECEKTLAEIEQVKIGAEVSKAPIDEFSKKVAQRDIQLENQEVKTKEYLTKLAAYTAERGTLLGEAKSLIESAKTALGYKTAEGLSAAFIEKYKEAKDDNSTWVWIGVSAVFLFGAIVIGVWVTLDSETAIELVVGRVSLIPIFLGGAWFAAAQYIKQRNIAEEYAYKSVLVRSMVGFSEQISGSDGKGEDHSHYVRNVLAEIHMNPLRKQKSPEKEKTSNEVVDLLREIKEPLEKIVDRATSK